MYTDHNSKLRIQESSLPEVKTNPTFPTTQGRILSSSGCLSNIPLMAFLIMVFLPIKTSALPRSEARICCICRDPTLSAFTCERRKNGFDARVINTVHVVVFSYTSDARTFRNRYFHPTRPNPAFKFYIQKQILVHSEMKLLLLFLALIFSYKIVKISLKLLIICLNFS